MMIIYLLILIGVGILFIGAFFTLFFIRKVEPGYVGVRVGLGGYVISDTWVLGIPFLTTYNKMDITVQKLEIARKGGERVNLSGQHPGGHRGGVLRQGELPQGGLWGNKP